ncbi:hypothetical protein T484DRAFT_3431381 [Baffinella frigidus]|nr:hypothetical protein T484DRAFT_3431381 [Cryptophyta sp. CCMP2293]
MRLARRRFHRAVLLGAPGLGTTRGQKCDYFYIKKLYKSFTSGSMCSNFHISSQVICPSSRNSLSYVTKPARDSPDVESTELSYSERRDLVPHEAIIPEGIGNQKSLICSNPEGWWKGNPEMLMPFENRTKARAHTAISPQVLTNSIIALTNSIIVLTNSIIVLTNSII